VQIDYSLPQSVESEKTLLGKIFLDNDLIWTVIKSLKPDDFYSPQHQKIFEAMTDLANKGKVIEYVLVVEYIKDKYGEIIEIEELSNLTVNIPTTSHVQDYINIIKAKSHQRQKIRLYSQAEQTLLNNDFSSLKIIEGNLDKLNIQDQEKVFENAGEGLENLLEEIYERSKHSSHITGLRTGYKKLDYLTSGLQKQDLILIAARPGIGKTSFCINVAEYIGLTGNEIVAIFSLEMSKKALKQRLISSIARINSQRIRNGFLTIDEWARLLAAKKLFGKSNIYINDQSGITVLDIKAHAKMLLKEKKRLDLIIIDYLQLMQGIGRFNSLREEVTQISRDLKIAAKDLDVPIIALSQLSRASESRSEHRPQLPDLRESGALEQDADIVGFIYRDEEYEKNDDNIGLAELIIAKQRNGPIDTVPLFFVKEYTKFENLLEISH
jgi:replicative DNA helicase